MSCNDRIDFAYQMGKYTTLSIGQVRKLMRLAATHDRIETELTNGYHSVADPQEWDEVATKHAKAKRDRIEKRLEVIAALTSATIDYGALTVRIVASGRDIYIPGGAR